MRVRRYRAALSILWASYVPANFLLLEIQDPQKSPTVFWVVGTFAVFAGAWALLARGLRSVRCPECGSAMLPRETFAALLARACHQCGRAIE